MAEAKESLLKQQIDFEEKNSKAKFDFREKIRKVCKDEHDRWNYFKKSNWQFFLKNYEDYTEGTVCDLEKALLDETYDNYRYHSLLTNKIKA